MRFSRKQFVGAAVAGVSAASLSTPRGARAAAGSGDRAPVHFHILRPSEFNHGLLKKTLSSSKPYKQVFQAAPPLVIAPGVASLYLHMQNSMNAFEFSLGLGRGSLATLGVLMGPSVVFALNDATWQKYGIGAALSLAPSNLYYHATSNLNANASPDDPNGIYQDWSAQAVMHRGGAFMVCHNALTAAAAVFAQKHSASPQSVLSDFEKNLLPGFLVVPAGVAAVQLAQEHGWKPFAII